MIGVTDSKLAKPSPERAKVRLLELDALRGIAAAAVVLYHFTTRYNNLFGHTDELAFSVPWGHYGVQLFFVISGFVILMTLERTTSVLDFAVARFARLYPVYWVAGLTTFTVVTIWGPKMLQVDARSALLNATMLQKLFSVEHIDVVYWTLRRELLFYFLMAAIVAVRLRRHLTLIVVGLVAFDIVDMRFGLTASLSDGRAIRAVLSLRYLHLFLLGIVFYQMRSGWRWWQGAVVGLCLLGAGGHGPVEETLIIAGITAIVFAATQFPIPWLGNKAFVFLGTVSYSFYLIHQNVGYVLIRFGYAHGINGNLSIVGAILLTFTLACALNFSVERPANRWLRARYKAWTKRRQPLILKLPEKESAPPSADDESHYRRPSSRAA